MATQSNNNPTSLPQAPPERMQDVPAEIIKKLDWWLELVGRQELREQLIDRLSEFRTKSLQLAISEDGKRLVYTGTRYRLMGWPEDLVAPLELQIYMLPPDAEERAIEQFRRVRVPS